MRKMIDDDESLCFGTRRGAALHLSLFSRGNGWWNPSQWGNKLDTSTLHDAMLPARSRNQRPGEENNRSEHWNTQNTVTLYRLMTWILLKTRTHIHTMNWNAVVYNTHKWQVVDCNLFQIQILPLLSHIVSPVTTQEACMKTFLQCTSTHWRRVEEENHCHTFGDPPPPSSGTWHGQCLAVESCWQQSWKNINKNPTKILATGTLFDA